MSGCPAWYDLPSLGRAFQPPQAIRQIVVTTPRRIRLVPQAVQLLWAAFRQFPDTVRYCVFHRGYRRDAHTSARKAWPMRMLVLAANLFHYQIVNAAYDLSRIAFYRECDLHIGYRVHAQINFLSMRKPSLLLCEDGRGEGLSQTLDLYDLPAYDNPKAVLQIMQRLRGDLENGFRRFATVAQRIDTVYESVLVPFLGSIP